MIVLLNADQVAERLGVAKRTAMSLMMEMNPVTISGSVRKRYRVTEDNLERFIMKRMQGKPETGTVGMSRRKLARR